MKGSFDASFLLPSVGKPAAESVSHGSRTAKSGSSPDVGGDDLLRIQMDGVSVPYLGSFEGTVPAYIGLDERRPYRVLTLQNPTRVVVDVQTGN